VDVQMNKIIHNRPFSYIEYDTRRLTMCATYYSMCSMITVSEF
jgi:hypothetical protein